jgi:hypothetical protein
VWAERRSPQTASSRRCGGVLCRMLQANFGGHLTGEVRRTYLLQRVAMSLTHIASSQCTMLTRKDLHKCLRAHGAEDHVRGTRSIPSHAAMSRRPCAQDHDTQETS